MRAHARHVRDHVTRLAAKAYWREFAPSPEFVVMFVPSDAFLAPRSSTTRRCSSTRCSEGADRDAVDADRDAAHGRLRLAAGRRRRHARAVFELGRELYGRLGTLGGHVDKLGRSLGRAVDDYNRTVGSLERSVLVQARKMAELQVTDAELAAPPPIDTAPRPLGAPELLESVDVRGTLMRPRPPWSCPSVEPGRALPESVEPGREAAESVEPDRGLPSVEELVTSLEQPPPHLRKAQCSGSPGGKAREIRARSRDRARKVPKSILTRVGIAGPANRSDRVSFAG